MMHYADLPDTIPIFPLPGALLLPRSRLPLHLFEPRYLAMFDDALKTPERLIGMIQPRKTPDGRDDTLHTIGCVGRITQFTETEDNRYMITLRGLSRYRIVSELEGFQPYRRAEVSWQGFERDLGPKDEDPKFERESFMKLLNRYFATRELKTDWEALKEAEDELLVNSLSMLLAFQPEERQALLEAPALSSRRETLIALIEYAIRGGTNDEILQ